MPDPEQPLVITGPYITLAAALKLAGAISSGGQAKEYLARSGVRVNGVLEQRRGRKLYPGDLVLLPNGDTARIVDEKPL
ncbi:MAG TPA: RNA-binding S4 domain-containing protein [Chthonomonadales bacterium]|nr:RNA-binding S4 domain-containing protein [Chthonomonadales bacterium]